jgi:glucokinase
VTEPVAIGIDVGGTKLVAATIAADGTVLDRQRRETPARDETLLLRTLARAIRELGGTEGSSRSGSASPGSCPPTATSATAPTSASATCRWRAACRRPPVPRDRAQRRVRRRLRRAAGRRGRGRRDLVMFTLGTGVGGGVVVGGQVVLGQGGFAGELGHVIVAEGGRACPCGNRGCVEAYASGTSIGLIARERLVDLSVDTLLRDEVELTGRGVTQAALAGDAFATSVLVEAGHWLGVAAGTLVNVLDPEVILLGGGAAVQTSRWIVPAAEAALADHLIGSPWRVPPAFELAALGDDAGMVGAALLAADRRHGQGAT